MTPQENQQIDDRAKKTIQEVTGTPAMSLRGLTPQETVANFIAKQLSTPSVSIPPQDTEVKSTITIPPASSLQTNEQPISPPSGGGGAGGGTFTARTVLVVSGTPTIATQDFVTP